MRYPFIKTVCKHLNRAVIAFQKMRMSWYLKERQKDLNWSMKWKDLTFYAKNWEKQATG